MKKESPQEIEEDLRPEYDLSQLRGGVRGKYYQQARAGTNLVVIEPDLAGAFPDEKSVNRALRLLLTAANAATRGPRGSGVALNKQLKRTAGKTRPLSR